MTQSEPGAALVDFGSVRRAAVTFGVAVSAVVITFVLLAVAFLAFGVDPVAAFRALYEGSIGTGWGIAVSLTFMTPLLLAGLGVAVGFRSGIFNIGVEGQLYMGALGCTVVALLLPDAPAIIVIPLAMLGGVVAGGLWGAIPGILKVTRNTNEIVVCLMLNFTGIFLVTWLVSPSGGPLAAVGASDARSADIPMQAQLPILVQNTSLHVGLLIGLAVAVALGVMFRYTTLGFRLRAIGKNAAAARFSGMSPRLGLAGAIILGGAIAGMAGASEILGIKWALYANFSGGVGYSALAVSLLARNHPIAVIPSAFFFGALNAGAINMSQTVGIDASIMMAVQATIIIAIAVGFGVGPWDPFARLRARLFRREQVHPSVDQVRPSVDQEANRG